MEREQEAFTPTADVVDGELFIETAQTGRATAALWRVLRVSRQEPTPWLPLVVLCGPHGAGTTTIARRFVRAARREAACALLPRGSGDRWSKGAWEEEMVRRHGACPEHCHPAIRLSEADMARALRAGEAAHPAIDVVLEPLSNRKVGFAWRREWSSPGNRSHHPTKRTSVAVFEGADRLLSVPPGRRRDTLDELTSRPSRFVGHAVSIVLVGSPALAEAVSEYASTQVIKLEAMPDDAAFARVVGMVFGTCEAGEVAALHRSSRGLMGALVHIARTRGLSPPFSIRPDEIVRLPGLPAPGRPSSSDAS